ncbi:GtrA family protein [Actinobacillus succinogenes]|uniref:GtrA family protein n=1 Tax=Actinobacillus succinogenes (strain ATCC 55618 / DSM 22257 / CCUG 43843 / 130Z) TaxID=339671 RepID=A6VNJ5_ACTSZ|nr:GtrA family protein [Actinobacillus succinogenes]ABR74542.1 GtrA family protein [Actinobacillus succinogenes 130Z]PHI41037.1 GtrA family protein [Actinobacillus succinogenes]
MYYIGEKINLLQKINFFTIHQFLVFGISGILGFVVDTSILYLFKDSLGLYQGRLLSFTAAVITTWLFNRTITFKTKKERNIAIEFLYYFFAMIIGGLVNLISYYISLRYQLIITYPILGVAIGSITGMLINFISSKWFIFRS